jgi:hypothetical protein
MTQRLLIGLLALTAIVCAQHRVDPRNTYHRVIAVVPMIGTGTATDPRRPQYAPWGVSAATGTASGIIGFTQVPTDDGKFAIVEFVARDRKSLAAILADTTITSFEKGLQSKATIETALQKVKKNFDLVQFEVVMP